MTQNYQVPLTHRIAEESQLQAEEKWIIDALSKIKSQRNCLQIERLQLESMKNQLKNSTTKNLAEAAKLIEPLKATTTFSISMAAPKPPGDVEKPMPVHLLSTPNRKLLEAEEHCNRETLQLGVNKSMFSMNSAHQFNIEEYEEEDEEIGDDLLLDMNMFMNCTQQQP